MKNTEQKNIVKHFFTEDQWEIIFSALNEYQDFSDQPAATREVIEKMIDLFHENN